MVVPYDEKLGVHPQAESFTEHAFWDFDSTTPDHYPLLLHFPYFDLYRKQVVKQADLVLAMHLCPQAFTAEQKVRNFAYYERITVRDSSLSAATQAVLAAETGHLDLAYDYFCETSRTWRTTPTTAYTSRHWPVPGPPWWPGSVGCVTSMAAAWPSHLDCPRR
jgi:alpha,alpha-trehalose phosphorylase